MAKRIVYLLTKERVLMKIIKTKINTFKYRNGQYSIQGKPIWIDTKGNEYYVFLIDSALPAGVKIGNPGSNEESAIVIEPPKLDPKGLRAVVMDMVRLISKEEFKKYLTAIFLVTIICLGVTGLLLFQYYQDIPKLMSAVQSLSKSIKIIK